MNINGFGTGNVFFGDVQMYNDLDIRGNLVVHGSATYEGGQTFTGDVTIISPFKLNTNHIKSIDSKILFDNFNSTGEMVLEAVSGDFSRLSLPLAGSTLDLNTIRHYGSTPNVETSQILFDTKSIELQSGTDGLVRMHLDDGGLTTPNITLPNSISSQTSLNLHSAGNTWVFGSTDVTFPAHGKLTSANDLTLSGGGGLLIVTSGGVSVTGAALAGPADFFIQNNNGGSRIELINAFGITLSTQSTAFNFSSAGLALGGQTIPTTVGGVAAVLTSDGAGNSAWLAPSFDASIPVTGNVGYITSFYTINTNGTPIEATANRNLASQLQGCTAVSNGIRVDVACQPLVTASISFRNTSAGNQTYLFRYWVNGVAPAGHETVTCDTLASSGTAIQISLCETLNLNAGDIVSIAVSSTPSNPLVTTIYNWTIAVSTNIATSSTPASVITYADTAPLLDAVNCQIAIDTIKDGLPVIVYKPGATTQFPVCGTFADLAAAMGDNPDLQFTILIDDSITSPAVFQTINMRGCYWVGVNKNAVVHVTVQAGATVTNLGGISNLQLLGPNDPIPPLAFSSSSPFIVEGVRTTMNTVSGSSPFVEVSGSNDFKIIVRDGAQLLGAVGRFVIAMDTLATCHCQLQTGAFCADNSIAGSSTTHVFVTVDDSCRIPTLSGTMSITTSLLSAAVVVSYDDSVSPPTGANTVQGALDALKANTGPASAITYSEPFPHIGADVQTAITSLRNQTAITPSNFLVYIPGGGIDQLPVCNTLSQLISAIGRDPLINYDIYISDINSPVNIFTSFNARGSRFIGLPAYPVVMNFNSGIQITNCFGVENVNVQGPFLAGSPPFIFSGSSGTNPTFTVQGPSCTLNTVSGNGSFFTVAGGSNIMTLVAKDGAHLAGAVSREIISLNTGGTANVYLENTATCDNFSFAGSSGTFVNIFNDSTCTAPSLAGTFNMSFTALSTAARTSYDDSTSPPLGSSNVQGALDALKTAGANGFTAPYCIFQPGAISPNFPILDTWTKVKAHIALTRGALTIWIAGDCTIDSDTDFQNRCTLRSYYNSGHPTITIQDGVQLTDLHELNLVNLTGHFTTVVPLVFTDQYGILSITGGTISFDAMSAQPFTVASGSGFGRVLALSENGNFDHTLSPATAYATADTSGGCVLVMFQGSSAADGIFTDDGSGTALIIVDASSTPPLLPGFSGGVTKVLEDTAALTAYDDSKVSPVLGSSNVQGALDALKTAVTGGSLSPYCIYSSGATSNFPILGSWAEVKSHIAATSGALTIWVNGNTGMIDSNTDFQKRCTLRGTSPLDSILTIQDGVTVTDLFDIQFLQLTGGFTSVSPIIYTGSSSHLTLNAALLRCVSTTVPMIDVGAGQTLSVNANQSAMIISGTPGTFIVSTGSGSTFNLNLEGNTTIPNDAVSGPGDATYYITYDSASHPPTSFIGFSGTATTAYADMAVAVAYDDSKVSPIFGSASNVQAALDVCKNIFSANLNQPVLTTSSPTFVGMTLSAPMSNSGQPAMSMSISAPFTLSSGGWHDIVFDTVNSSQGTWPALAGANIAIPTTGWWLLTAQIIIENSSSVGSRMVSVGYLTGNRDATQAGVALNDGNQNFVTVSFVGPYSAGTLLGMSALQDSAINQDLLSANFQLVQLF